MRRILGLLVLIFSVAACSDIVPTPLPPVSTPNPTLEVVSTPIDLPTFTPAPLNDPQLLDLKKMLKQGFETKNGDVLINTISYNKWVASIYRQGGTPPIDPRRGLELSLEFAKENKLTVDVDRPTYEPRWSVPLGDTSVLVLVEPNEGEPYHAHLYIQHEPSAWRFTGILTRVPYYDAPSIAQVRANPTKYDGKEYMYVGAYQPKANPPSDAGAPPAKPAFVLQTFAGPLWVAMLDESYVGKLPADADSKAGQLVRVFGIIKLNNGAPYLESDSVEFIKPDSWAHTQGVIEKVDTTARRVTIKPNGQGASQLKLTDTTSVSLPDATRGKVDDIKSGQTIDATGVPQQDGTLLVEELFIAK